MPGKTVLISGATDGIGRQTALELARQGHEVILHGRNPERGQQTIESIYQETGNTQLHYYNADLSSFDAISSLAEDINRNFQQLDVLINNAGIFEHERSLLPKGLERSFMVNHLAPFALSLQLINLLKQSAQGRIITLSSMAQAGSIDFDNLNGQKYFDGYHAYALSKLGNVLFTYKLHRLLTHSPLTVYCLHPGVVSTKLLHSGWGPGGAPLTEGAKTPVFLATSDTVTSLSGHYFIQSSSHRSCGISYDHKIQDRLWKVSEALSGLSYPG